MGARFDKWLARPSTLHFLRLLIGPEQATVRSKRPCWKLANVTGRRQYATAHWKRADLDNEPANRKATVSPGLYYEHRKRVAKELGLRIPAGDGVERSFDPSIKPELSSTSYSQLLQSEAHVRNLSTCRRLLIDEPENFANLEAWSNILQYRERVDGYSGIRDVWKGMQMRGINLPVDGKLADIFWTKLLHAAIVQKPFQSHDRLLEEVFAHAVNLKTTGLGHYHSLYSVLIGRFLRVAPSSNGAKDGPEYHWHVRSRAEGFCEAMHLCDVVDDVFGSIRQPVAFTRWRRLYYDFKGTKFYDQCMSLVFKHAEATKSDTRLVVRWHNLFIANDDWPGSDISKTASVRSLLGNPNDDGTPRTKAVVERELIKALEEDRKDTAQSMTSWLSRASMSGLVGDVHGIKAKPISDKFCARMFATHAFSLETVIRGLALLGTDAIGPMALRELAIRAASPQVLQEKLTDLKNTGISVTPSTYGNILEQLISSSQTQLFQTLLDSDQHPESYDDQHMQETLLSEFLETQQWSLAHITLIGLSHTDWNRAARAWNRLLQVYIKAHNHPEIVRIFNHICAEQMPMTTRSLRFMRKYMLAERAPGKRPVVSSNTTDGNFISLNFVVNAHMYAATKGLEIPPERWIELLKRFGMTGNMEGVARLAPWLAAQYPGERSTVYKIGDSQLHHGQGKNSMQARIFNPTMLMAILIWGHHSAGMRDQLQPTASHSSQTSSPSTSIAPWARGLELLLQLKRCGIKVRTDDVRHAIVQVLWTLFGPGISKRAANVQGMKRNQLSMLQYVRQANKIWDETLFELPSLHSSKECADTPAPLLVAVFGQHRLADQKTGAWVDIEAWAAARDAGMWHDPPPTWKDRLQETTQSEFRVFDNFTTRKERQLAHRRQRGLKPSQISSQQHPPPSAQPSNSYPPPNQPDTPEGPGPYYSHPRSVHPSSGMSARHRSKSCQRAPDLASPISRPPAHQCAPWQMHSRS